MPTATYLPEARDDIDLAFVHYESCHAGLGARFVAELQRVVALIEALPLMYAEVMTGGRAATMRRFPYVVYYQVVAGNPLIIAVRHGHDNPAVWQARAPNP